jgi:hypothetical protein
MKSGNVTVNIDHLILDSFPELDPGVFSTALQKELNEIISHNAAGYDWHRMYSMTRLDAGKISITDVTQSSGTGYIQTIAANVAQQLCQNLFRSND